MAVGEARPGYELWRPNRQKPGSQTTRFLAVLLLLVSIGLMLIVTLTGWSLLLGGALWGVIALVFCVVYGLIAYMISRWSRGALALTIALSVLLAILCAVGVESWFVRARPGFTEGALPSDLIGLFVVILIPVQAALAVVCAIAFGQEWHVEEERPIGSGGDEAAGAVGATG
ncbi:MAG: hypothetical protein M9938_05010 [Solirubrobacterales bacterium]|nr:hypothetical protein [Solirubrobacterales bacterium]